jgi:lysophospholipase L1-like esterase
MIRSVTRSTISKSVSRVVGGGGASGGHQLPSKIEWILQTHNSVEYEDLTLGGTAFRPTGLFTDTAGTNPAAAAGDLIARWDDVFSGNDYSFQQAIEASRPALQFEPNADGIYVPVVRFDGTGKSLRSTSTAIVVFPEKRGGYAWSFRTRSSTLRYPGNFNGANWLYTWAPTRLFYSGAFVSSATPAFDNGRQVHQVTRKTDTTYDYHINGALSLSSTVADKAVITGFVELGKFGGSNLFNGDITVFAGTSNNAYSSEINDYVTSLSPAYAEKVNTVICDGNSLTYGINIGANPGNYPDQLQSLLGDTWTVKNVGVSSQSTPAMTTAAPSRVDANFGSATNKVTVCWEGTNHLFFGATATAAYDALVAYCAARQADGQQVVICTILPRSSSGTPVSFEADRQTLNSNIVANWATFADALADIAADSRIGDAGDESDLTYYLNDLVHLNSAGYGVVAGIVKSAIDTL